MSDYVTDVCMICLGSLKLANITVIHQHNNEQLIIPICKKCSPIHDLNQFDFFAKSIRFGKNREFNSFSSHKQSLIVMSENTA